MAAVSCPRCSEPVFRYISQRTDRPYYCNEARRRGVTPVWHNCAPVAPAAPVLSDEEKAAKAWLEAYTGNFSFLREMQDRVSRGLRMSAGQWAAVARCQARDLKRSHGRSVSGGRAKKAEDLVTASFGRGGTLEEVIVTGDPWA